MVRNFLFHRVSPQRDALWDPMDPKLFEQCVKFISSRYEVVLIEDLVAGNARPSKKSYATICFDDGYKDNIEYAFPLLKKHKCKASFYVVTDCIEHNIPTWTHIFESRFQFTNNSGIDTNFDFLPVEYRVTSLPTKAERIAYAKKLKPFLKTLTHEQRHTVLETVDQAFQDVEIPKLMMNWADLRELKAGGNYIGSHTVTHGMLGTMSDERQVTRELKDSAGAIEKNVGHFPITISYPVGSYNEMTMRLSKEAGYQMGLAVKQDVYDPERDDRYEIPRIELYNEPFWKTRLRITTTLERFKKLIRK